jgi:HPt (histidine-containing phosphotransfer) domain-containing protein
MFLENGFNDYLSKPIDVRRLDAVLREWIPAGKRQSAPKNGGGNAGSAALPETLLPEIEGLDAAAGLARIGGLQSRYLDLLETFCRDVEAGFAPLGEEPEESSLRSFVTLVHALKSALANIGAPELSRAAALLEQAGREADLLAIRENLAPFRARLGALRSRIGEFLASARGKGEKPADAEIMEALTRLRAALEAKDFDAMDAALARAQSRAPTGAMGEAISEIADFILTAEFEKAADAVNALIG